MRVRRVLPYAVLVLLLAGFAAAAWRSAGPRAETGASIAGELLCPACQGESVAQSQSPMAAAMRDTIAAQLAEGRSPEQIRQYFVDRYGPGILADPPHGGLGVVLWVVPLVVLALLGYLVWRSRRRRTGPASPTAVARRWSPRYWDLAAAGVVAMVAVVAVAGPRAASPAAQSGTQSSTQSSTQSGTQSGTTLVDLGRSLEAQGRYAEAADVYRDAVAARPDDDVRLRLAFDLLRANRAGEAGTVAQQVLTDRPTDTQALLLLGLAQRATGSSAAAATLHRFLAAAPNDPAAAQVRRLLASPS